MSDRVASRDVLGQTLTDLAENDPNIVVLDADFCPASKITGFRDRFPERFFQIGIAEQNMMSIAGGLATVGFTCFASTICVFCSRRACDQVAASIALPHLNVKIIGLYAGLFVGKNGATHQSLEDIAIMRALAGMVVCQPADAIETKEIIKFAAKYVGPMYIRIGRDPMPQFLPSDYKFQLGKWFTLRQGKDVTIFTYGDTVEYTMQAADLLAEKGIDACVVNASSLKPVDTETIVKAAKETGRIVTVDNHNIYGGLGSAVAETVTENIPVPVKRIGVKDVFGKSGTNIEMAKKFGLDPQSIATDIESFLTASPCGTSAQ
jgi:transketolase